MEPAEKPIALLLYVEDKMKNALPKATAQKIWVSHQPLRDGYLLTVSGREHGAEIAALRIGAESANLVGDPVTISLDRKMDAFTLLKAKIVQHFQSDRHSERKCA